MRLVRKIACVPFLLLAALLALVETPVASLALLCLRTVELIIDKPAVTEYFKRLFLLRAVRCPRCGRSDIETIDD
jgi:hypothetical protein